MVALANPRGGVGRTLSALYLGEALAACDVRVLLVDLDPLAGLSTLLGHEPERAAATLGDVVAGRRALTEVLAPHEGFDLAPASADLAGAESTLLSRRGREFVLRDGLAGVEADYDVVVVDTPPALGILTLNALSAADEVVVPARTDALSARGACLLGAMVGDVQRLTNPAVVVRGLLVTAHDPRPAGAIGALGRLCAATGLDLAAPPVPHSARLRADPEAPRSRRSAATAAYRVLARTLLGRTVGQDLVAAAGWSDATARAVVEAAAAS